MKPVTNPELLSALEGKPVKDPEILRQLQAIDEKTGAPASVRAVVGPSYRSPEDRLQTLRRFYPGARPYGDENFLIQEGGRQRLYNPPGMDVGDLAEYGRIVPETLGGAVGGAVGTLGSAPTGLLSAPVAVPLGVGLGASMGGQAYDLAMENLFGRQDTRSLGERGAEAVTDVTLNAAAQKAVPALQELGGRLVGNVRNRLAGRSAQGMLEDYARAGIPLEGAAGFIGSSRPVQGLNEALAKLPTSSRKVGEAIDLTLDSINRFSDDVARSAGGTSTTKQQAGETIRAGVQGAGRRLSERGDALQNQVWDLVGRDTPVTVNAVEDLLSNWQAQVARSPKAMDYLNPVIKQAQKIIDDASETGAVPFDVLRSFRTHIGRMTERPDVAGYVGGTPGQLNRLYGALSQDLNQAAESASPAAKKALDTYNRYMRYQLGVNKPLLEKVEGMTPDVIMDRLLAGGRRGATELSKLRRNLKPEEWDDLVTATVEQMGRATPGKQNAAGDAFSVNTFLTNWNRLSPEAKATLFGGKRYTPFRRELDRLVRIVSSAKDAEAMKNYSGTAQQNMYMQMAQGGLPALALISGNPEQAAMAATVTYGGPYALAKLMTKPAFVRWLARGVRIPATDYNSLAAHAGRLALMAKAEPEVKDEIYQFLAAMRDTYATAPEASDSPARLRTE